MDSLLASFRRWLDQNQGRFSHKPLPSYRKRGDGSNICDLAFRGINPAITAFVTKDTATVAVEYLGEVWDYLIAFDITPEQMPGGAWFCSQCEEAHREYFAAFDELAAQHCFESLLEWCNQHFTPDAWLTIHGEIGHTTWARIETPAILNPWSSRPELRTYVSPVCTTEGRPSESSRP